MIVHAAANKLLLRLLSAYLLVQGTFLWRTGERYDGEWKNGQEDGQGIFTWADGSVFDGFWSKGRKHGIGLFRPSLAVKALTGALPARAAIGSSSADADGADLGDLAAMGGDETGLIFVVVIVYVLITTCDYVFDT